MSEVENDVPSDVMQCCVWWWFCRVGALECELKMLKTSANMLELESRRKDDVLQQSTQAMTMMEEEHTKLRKVCVHVAIT